MKSIEAAGGKVIANEADSADPLAITAAVAKSLAAFGLIDVVVVNAGITRIGMLDGFALENLDRMLAANVRGVFLAVEAAAWQMRDGGRVISIGSNTAMRSSSPGPSVYAMPKAALATNLAVWIEHDDAARHWSKPRR